MESKGLSTQISEKGPKRSVAEPPDDGRTRHTKRRRARTGTRGRTSRESPRPRGQRRIDLQP